MFVVVAEVVGCAQQVERFLNVLCATKVAVVIFEAYVFGTQVSQRGEQIAAIFEYCQAVIHLQYRELAIEMRHAFGRLCIGEGAGVKGWPLDLGCRCARRDQPVVS